MQKFDIDTLDLPGKQLVDAMDDPQRMRNDGVGAGRAEVVGRKTFQDLVRDRFAASMASCNVVASVTPVPSRLDAWTPCLFGESLDLLGSPVHDHYPDVQ